MRELLPSAEIANDPADVHECLLHRWQDETVRAGRTITRIALAFEAGRERLA